MQDGTKLLAVSHGVQPHIKKLGMITAEGSVARAATCVVDCSSSFYEVDSSLGVSSVYPSFITHTMIHNTCCMCIVHARYLVMFGINAV